MREFTLPDGTVIELRSTSAVTGPAQKGGQHYGMSFLWYRVGGGAWTPSNHRTLFRALEWLSLCESLADFLEGERE